VCSALADGQQIKPSFFNDTVERALTNRSATGARFVFVLDEYETLFGRLWATARREPELRFTVVQPLLNQMVEFARDNLIVFLGQQPTAHFIFMEQNQLSPYVQQDSFPLFHHEQNSTRTEFGELVHNVLTDIVAVDQGFVSALYAETTGHPFLTVNVLRELVDWLIEQRRPVADLSLSSEDMRAFAEVKLEPKGISLSKEYLFFRETIAEAISTEGRAQTPWLYAVYSVLRHMCRESPSSFGCTRNEFDALVKELGLSELGFTSDAILSTASQANFLSYNDSHVWARIRVLGRIAAITQPRIHV
jgi:hypothetical protein